MISEALDLWNNPIPHFQNRRDMVDRLPNSYHASNGTGGIYPRSLEAYAIAGILNTAQRDSLGNLQRVANHFT